MIEAKRPSLPCAAVKALITVCLLLPYAVGLGAERELEEIVVTARHAEETLQDVPATVATISAEDLDRYHIDTLTEAAKFVPNFQIYHGESGNGATLRLRGVSSSDISAAFDQSVAINIDGVVINFGRFVHNSYLDMQRLEVLKGPQSLYFGKSATAGVVSVTTNDPTEKWVFEGMLGYEAEYDQQYYQAVLGGPLTETLGVRLALGKSNSDELVRNLWPGVHNEYRGEEATNARLTLRWEPSETFQVRFKHSESTYDNDGANGHIEEYCPEGRVQPTSIPSVDFSLVTLPGIDDCELNGNTSINDLNPTLATGLPYGGGDGVPFLEQDTALTSLQLEWALDDKFELRAVTGYADLDHTELDVYDYNAGVFGGLHRNIYTAFSQEIVLRSNLQGPVNFLFGAYFQDVEQRLEAYQSAFNLALVPNILNFDPATQPISTALGFDPTPGALFGLDPTTGRGGDYSKIHHLDTEVRSVFAAASWDVSDTVEITTGVRYTQEEKEGYIELPYFHAAAGIFGFGGFDRVDGLEFEDDNLSPEATVNWYVTPDISLFAAYKKGFKSGGIDNSALPTAALNPNSPNFAGFDFLYFDSEEAEGFEVGMKARFLDGALNLNTSLFEFIYTDLQVQLFDANIVQFSTFNASELTTRGIEADFQYLTPIEGLFLRGNIAITDAETTDDFIVGQDPFGVDINLKGLPAVGSPDLEAGIGFTYDIAVSDGWRLDFSGDVRYTDDYSLTATRDPLIQEAFVLSDASMRLYTADERYEWGLIVRNIGDKIYALVGGTRTGACPTNTVPGSSANCLPNATSADQDAIITTSLGRTLTMRFKVRF